MHNPAIAGVPCPQEQNRLRWGSPPHFRPALTPIARNFALGDHQNPGGWFRSRFLDALANTEHWLNSTHFFGGFRRTSQSRIYAPQITGRLRLYLQCKIKMRFDWDDANINHLASHGVTPKEFEQAFRNDPIRLYRTLHHRERRYAALGQTDQDRVLLFIYTKRGRKTRAITAHTAPRKLRKSYGEQKSTKR